MRTMFDAVNASNIPRSAQMVAGYVDQITLAPWTAADWALFPTATKVEIVKKSTSNFGHVLDVETGDALPSQAPGWVHTRRQSGADPTVYCNYSTWPAIRSAFAVTGVAEPHWWIAKYDGLDSFPSSWGPGVVAKQYKNTPGYDLSVVADYWPGVDPPHLLPTTGNEDSMLIAPASTDDYIDVPTDGRRSLYISSSYGRHVTVLDVVCVGDTPGPVGADYIADGLTTLDILPDRPGALALPPGVRVTKIRYSAVHPFTVWTA